ncbi:hypothetical protein GTQ48_08005 [Alteromonas genovensis]|uniref:MotA/TolQ/ExbB proton channel domain-containing protein n=1 Tax=Alteromonas genovensis TaxID=471225 RepID=A0A6N9TE79_9ALTE|nr:hypothetical protein [Alteromonas genovensis]NDW15461.1 hypothetical protein [Alteromonas genovensis]
MEDNQTGTLSTEKYKIDADTLRKAFIIHSLVGLILCLAIAGFNIPILVAVILSSAVMGSYYFQYHKGGKPIALLGMFSDSIYYLGFLLTLISLVCSMLFFNIEEGASSASVVISQFGAAMITTLLGMGTRIYLQNFDTSVETAQLSARESLDETVKGFNVQMRRTNDALSKLSNTMNKNIQDTEERNNKSIEMFEETQKKLISLGESSLTNFAKSTEKVLSESLTKLDTLGQQVSENLRQSSDKLIDESRGQFSRINKDIVDSLQTQFANLRKELAETFEVARDSSREFGSSVGEARASVRKLGSTAKDTSEKIAAIKHLAPDVSALGESQAAYIENLRTLSDEVSTRTKSMLNSEFEIETHMKGVAKDYKEVIDTYKQLISSSSAGKLIEEEEALLSALKKRISSIEQLSQQWGVEAKAMSEHSKDFSENLVKTAKFITHEMDSLSRSNEVVSG